MATKTKLINMQSRAFFIRIFVLIIYCAGVNNLSFCQTGTPFLPNDYTTGANNSIRTWDAMRPGLDATSISNPQQLRDVKQETQYFDGLGRLLQTVMKKGSLSTNGTPVDMIRGTWYDPLGREPYKFLPAPSTATDVTKDNGNFKLTPFAQQAAFYNSSNTSSPVYGQGESFFYGQLNFESSPLNRVSEVAAPGDSWAGTMENTIEANRRSIKTKYCVNTLTDVVRIWNSTNLNPGQFAVYSTPGIYPAGQLYKTITVDEKNKQVIEFKDKSGNIILKKVQLLPTVADDGTGRNNTGWLCTYYLYDDFNRLVCVVQPKGVEMLEGMGWVFNQQLSDELCFRYQYDARGNMIAKHVPGGNGTTVLMVYDARDRLVMTQDGRLGTVAQWIVTFYDELNRPVKTGMLYNTYFGTPAKLFTDHLTNAKNPANAPYPFNPASPPSSTYWSELSQVFYDNYDWLAGNGNPFSATRNTGFDNKFLTADNGNFPYPQALTQSSNLKGMITGTKTAILAGYGVSGSSLYSINYYGVKNELVQTQSTNITGGIDIVTNQYSFSGQLLRSYARQQKSGTNPQEHFITTNYEYDDLARLLSIKKTVSSTINGTTINKPETEIVRNQYDALGQLKTKTLAPAYNNNTGLQAMTYDYNIRGWVLGANRQYLATEGQTSDGKLFGFELGYDKLANKAGVSFAAEQWNGNINGMIWKSDGDDIRRKYDFSYDAANRLLKADFVQQNADDHAWNNSQVNYSMKMGDGSDPVSAYDANGNIKAMTQYGYKLGGNPQTPIDNLRYTYYANTNKLKNVVDLANDPVSKLGDFKTSALHNQAAQKNALTASSTQAEFDAITDYIYDANANVYNDLNKDIGKSGTPGIFYNHLNLPWQVTVYQSATVIKGTISYTYDASGNKLKKVTVENGSSANGNITTTTTTTYIGGIVYETKTDNNAQTTDYTDRLQFIAHEEGRIRFKHENNTFEYDYMLKDHLGNVRMVLTEEQKQDKYPVASLETAKINTEDDYYSIDQSKIVNASTVTGLPAYTNDNGIGNNPTDISFEMANSTKLYKVNGSDAVKTGLGITLKVMSGDRIDIHGKSYYFQNNTGGAAANTAVPVLEILNGLLGGPSGGVAAGAHGGVTGTQLNGYPGTTGGINTLLSNQTTDNNNAPQVPKAYINYIFFDEQFKSAGSGFSKLGSNGSVKDHFSELQNIVAPKNGYVYIYVSNESPVNVFFDNLQVVHTRGRIMEETHYYPFGLTMAGISSKALTFGKENKYRFNDGTEFANKEFIDGSGLEIYETPFRGYDCQIGRFWQVDEKADDYESFSPYSFSFDNPILFNDPSGLDPEGPDNVKTLSNVLVKSTYKNKWNYIHWALFVDLNKKHSKIDLFNYLKNQGVDDRGLLLFNQAWSGISYRQKKSEIDHAAWEIEAAIAEGAVSIIGGRIFLRIGLRYIPWSRVKSLLKELGSQLNLKELSLQAWLRVNNILNKGKREIFYALAEYAKKNPQQWEKFIKLGDKFVDFTKPLQKIIEKGIKKIDDLFD